MYILRTFKGIRHLDYSETEKTAPMIREDLPLVFDPATRTYHHPETHRPAVNASGMPDAVDIGAIILQTARTLHGPDAIAIHRAGCAPQLHRLLGQLAGTAGHMIGRAIEDALAGVSG